MQCGGWMLPLLGVGGFELYRVCIYPWSSTSLIPVSTLLVRH